MGVCQIGGFQPFLDPFWPDRLSSFAIDCDRSAGQIIEIDPEFRISSYRNNLPYRDATKIASIVETLRSAGLPE